MLEYFLIYLFIAFVVHTLSSQIYILPWFGDRQLTIGPPTSSFFWPVSLALNIYYDLFSPKKDD